MSVVLLILISLFKVVMGMDNSFPPITEQEFEEFVDSNGFVIEESNKTNKIRQQNIIKLKELWRDYIYKFNYLNENKIDTIENLREILSANNPKFHIFSENFESHVNTANKELLKWNRQTFYSLINECVHAIKQNSKKPIDTYEKAFRKNKDIFNSLYSFVNGAIGKGMLELKRQMDIIDEHKQIIEYYQKHDKFQTSYFTQMLNIEVGIHQKLIDLLRNKKMKINAIVEIDDLKTRFNQLIPNWKRLYDKRITNTLVTSKFSVETKESISNYSEFLNNALAWNIETMVFMGIIIVSILSKLYTIWLFCFVNLILFHYIQSTFIMGLKTKMFLIILLLLKFIPMN